MVQNLPPDTEEYVVLLLRKGGKVDAKTSKRIESTVKPLFENWGRDHLRLCHDHPGFVEDSDEDDTGVYMRPILNVPRLTPPLISLCAFHDAQRPRVGACRRRCQACTFPLLVSVLTGIERQCRLE